VQIPVGDASLAGVLEFPADAGGLVLFAHGSGSSRYSPRNQYVARVLRAAGSGTLPFDLLTREEEAEDAYRGDLRFDIAFLTEQLVAASRWLSSQPVAQYLPLGYFGSSTGAAATLAAAASVGPAIQAVVSRGSRPDLAMEALPHVTAATLLIVGIGHLVTVDLHAAQIEGFFHIPVDGLTAVPALCRALATQLPAGVVVVSPDEGRFKAATEYGRLLGAPLVVDGLGIPAKVIDAVADRQEQELKRRELAYRGHERPPELRGKTVLLVDDGIATGATMRAAARAVRLQGAAWLAVAVPTASSSGCAELAAEADEVVALLRPKCFFAVGQWYEEFSQTTDEEVSALLLKARQKLVSVGPRAES